MAVGVLVPVPYTSPFWSVFRVLLVICGSVSDEVAVTVPAVRLPIELVDITVPAFNTKRVEVALAGLPPYVVAVKGNAKLLPLEPHGLPIEFKTPDAKVAQPSALPVIVRLDPEGITSLPAESNVVVAVAPKRALAAPNVEDAYRLVVVASKAIIPPLKVSRVEVASPINGYPMPVTITAPDAALRLIFVPAVKDVTPVFVMVSPEPIIDCPAVTLMPVPFDTVPVATE